MTNCRRSLQELENSMYDNLLDDQDVERAHRTAQDIIIHVSMTTFSSNIDHKSLYHKGLLLFEAILFLSDKDILRTLMALRTLLGIKGTDRSKITLRSVRTPLTVHIIDLHAFHAVTVVALNNIPSSIGSIEGGTAIILSLFHHLLDFINVKNPYLIYATKAAHRLMNNYITNVSFQKFELLILSVASTSVMLPVCIKAVNYLDKMSEMLLKCWPATRVLTYLVCLQSLERWDSYDCQLVACLINISPSKIIAPFIKNVAGNMIVMLTQKNNKGAAKAFSAILQRLDVDTWMNIYVPALLRGMPVDFEDRRAYIRGTFYDCVSLAVKNFGGESLYAIASEVGCDIIYMAVVLYCGVSQGLLNTHDFQDNIKLMLHSLNSIVRDYAMKILCICNKKRFELTSWQLSYVLFYLELCKFNVNVDCSKNLYFLLSHICIRANAILSKENEEEPLMLALYTEFICSIYKYCMQNFKSKNLNRIKVAAEIFQLTQCAFEGDSNSLKTKYSLAKGDHFGKQEAIFYKHLTSQNVWYFNDEATFRKLLCEFIDSKKVYPEIALLLRKLSVSLVPSNGEYMARTYTYALALLCNKSDYESVEMGCHLIFIILSNKIQFLVYYPKLVTFINVQLFSKKLEFLDYKQLADTLMKSPVFGLTKCAACVLKVADTPTAFPEFLPAIFEHCENIIQRVLEHIHGIVANSALLFVKVIKVIEQTLITCLEVIEYVVTVAAELDSTYILRALKVATMIIEGGYMRKPITAAAVAVRQICLSALTGEDDAQQVLIIEFLEYILGSVYTAPNYLTSRFRRNPEHRLIIHAVVTADQRPQNLFLARAMDFLLGVLADPFASSGTTTSALHTVEIIMSDNSLRYSTLPFVSPIAVHCINGFSNKDWNIKNATTQVLQSLVNRLLGQKTEVLGRRVALEDVVVLFPKLALYFYAKLQDSNDQNVHDSVIAILAVLSESHRKSNLFLTKYVSVIVDCFLKIFLNIVCTDAGTIGIFAAKAYATLYPHVHIPFIICDIIQWLKLKFPELRKNIFYTCMCLLQELYERFNVFCCVPYYMEGSAVIELSFHSLTLFLEKFNYLYEFSLFSLLSVKSNRVDKIKKTVLCQLEQDSFQSRLWLNNNVPFMLNHVNVQNFPDMLKTCLDRTPSLSLKVHCLHSIINRFDELVKHSLISEILSVVLDSFLLLPFTYEYLIISYSHVILLLLDVCDFAITQDFLVRLRNEYKKVSKSSIYSVSVYVSLLTRIGAYTDVDQIFIKDAIIAYQNAVVTEDFELNFHAASTLKYLYKCVQTSDKHHVLKLAFMLLLSQETSFEMCKFMASIFEVQLSSTYITLATLLSFKNLINQLGDEVKACTFLVDLTVLVSSLDDIFEDNGRFYMKQNREISLHKYYLNRILLDKVKSAFMVIHRKSCVEILCNTFHKK